MSAHYRLYTYVFRKNGFFSWSHTFYVANTVEGNKYALEAAKREAADSVYRLPARKGQPFGKLIWRSPQYDHFSLEVVL